MLSPPAAKQAIQTGAKKKSLVPEKADQPIQEPLGMVIRAHQLHWFLPTPTYQLDLTFVRHSSHD